MKNYLQKILSIVIIFSTQACGMERPPREQSNPSSYIGVLPVELVRSVAPMFSTPGPETGATTREAIVRPRDNRRDPVIEATKNMRRFMQIMQEQFANRPLDNASIMKFLEVQNAFLAAHPEEKSSFASNIISTAAALNNHNVHLLLPEIVRQNFEVFRNLPQAEKDNTAITCMRFSPNAEVMGKLLDAGVDLNAQDGGAQFTLVRRAVEARSFQVLELLLLRRASPNVADFRGISPLMRAANLGDALCARSLLMHDCLPNVIDNKGRSALCFAARKGDAAMIDLLQAHGAHAFATGKSGKRNAFVEAVRSGKPEILKKLLDRCIIRIGESNTLEVYINQALIKAAEKGSMPMVDVLLPDAEKKDFDPKRNPKPDICLDEKNKYKTALSSALYAEHPEVALRLVEFARHRYYKGLSNLKKNRSYSLALAVKKKVTDVLNAPLYQQIIDIILEEEVDPMEITLCSSAAYFAASGGDAPLLKELIGHAALHEYLEHSKDQIIADLTILRDIELKLANKLLLAASQAGASIAVTTLMNYGAQATIADLHGNTPLHKAVVVADANTVGMIADLCVQKNSTANTPNESGNTPLHCAMNNPDIKTKRRVVKILLQNGAYANLPNKDGDTPLIAAAKAIPSNRGIIKTLLKYTNPKVDLEASNKKGETALFCAAAKGNYAVADQLLKAKANPNAKNNSGCSALSKAARHGLIDMTKLLIEYGGDIEAFKDSMLREAAKGSHRAYLQLILDKNPNINGQSSSDGDTPLHKAVRRNTVEAVKILLRAGADRSAKNFNGQTPLECATEICDDKIISLLMN